jgi:hypothetical protein
MQVDDRRQVEELAVADGQVGDVGVPRTQEERCGM